ncbi:MAG: very short patch repair endonuclease, partial [Pseudolabrys sp.]
PGKPDLVFSVRRSVVFVHGCFWHQHKGKKCGARPPKSKQAYWLPKLARTQARDKKNRKTLIAMGWRVLVIWECELRDIESARKRIIEFFKMPKIASSTN